MASSTSPVSGGTPSVVKKMQPRKAKRGSRLPTIIGISLACVFWTTASLAIFKGLASSPVQAPVYAGHALPKPMLALSQPVGGKVSKTPSGDLEALERMRQRFAEAIAATDGLGLLMLPAAMRLAEVDKSDRLLLARIESFTDPQAMAVLKEALGKFEAERQQAALAVAARDRRSGVDDVAPVDPMMTASIPAVSASSQVAALGYAAAPTASDVMAAADPREEPFQELLSEPEAADHGELPDDGPLPQAKPRATAIPAPEPPVATEAPEKPKKKTLANMLAYAKPDNPITTDDGAGGLFSRKNALPGPGSRIAVYVIEDATVHMPNGEKLRAHSGRAHMRDNPKYVHMKNQGPTPPNVYSLRMREARFHGIEAIRMTPVGDAKMYNRDGFLTHTYLLRRRGDSSGCVVFEDYNRFLNAFKRGHVKTLIVVPTLRDLPKYTAML
jgi:hypothetical protein